MEKPCSDYEYCCRLWLCSIPYFNGNPANRLMEHFGSAENVYNSEENEIKEVLPPGALRQFIQMKKEEDPFCLPEKLHKTNSNFTYRFDEEYPQKLLSIPDPPLGLFYKGTLPETNLPSVAIIGARECSAYGEHIAKELGSYLGRMGINVISGMARGIDGISQRSTLESGGKSFAVLGCGVDVCYPPSNRYLYDCLEKKGGIISTYGLGTPAKAQNFPSRNRIVSGLSDAVVVVEARQKSGTLITVDMALEQSREVYVVPGRITDRLSDGCNGLIGQGANVFLSPEIFVKELIDNINSGIPGYRNENISDRHKHFSGSNKYPSNLSNEQKAIYELLDLSPKSVEDICNELGENNDYTSVSLILMQLVMNDNAIQLSQGMFCLKP